MRSPRAVLATVGVLAIALTALAGPVHVASTDTGVDATVDPTSLALRVTPYEGWQPGDLVDPWASPYQHIWTDVLWGAVVPHVQFPIPVTYYAFNFTGATTEAMVSLTPSAGFGAAVAATSFVVPLPERRLLLVSMCGSTKSAGTVVQGVRIALRVSRSGLAVVGSTPVAVYGSGTAATTANTVNTTSPPDQSVGEDCVKLDDGNLLDEMGPNSSIVLTGQMQFGISEIGTATAGNDVILRGIIY